MALHFSKVEFERRLRATQQAMTARGLDAMAMFRQESMYYLTGYDSFGYVFFQCLVLTADGRMTLLTRAPDLRQAQHTSIIEDIRIWVDGPAVNPAQDIRNILQEHGMSGKRIGVEYDAYGLTAANGKRLDSALVDFASLEDASDLVSKQRAVKSAAEIDYVRRAAALTDDALDAAHTAIAPDAFEGDILAAMQGAIFKGGGDYPSNEFIIGAGRDALLCRYFSGRKDLGHEDQITLEWAGAYRHYHAAMMRTIVVGAANDKQREMHKVCLAAMAACQSALQPGEPVGKVFDAYAHTTDKAGMAAHRLNACGYSMGASFAPNWMDWPMFYADNPTIAEPGMVFFLHMILLDSTAGLAMCPGETVLVTDDGIERLSGMNLELVTIS